MSAILANQDNEHTWLGDAYHMLDDALDPPGELLTDRISVDWTVYDPTKKAALVEFPEMVRELSSAIDAAGFTETSVQYFAISVTRSTVPSL